MQFKMIFLLIQCVNVHLIHRRCTFQQIYNNYINKQTSIIKKKKKNDATDFIHHNS